MAWKNGGGETAEIAVFPEGACYDDFHWRLSMARIAADGPFSTFPNVDRTLALIEGNGMVIEAGVRAFVDRSIPLLTRSNVLPTGRVATRLGYAYEFVTGTVPTVNTKVFFNARQNVSLSNTAR